MCARRAELFWGRVSRSAQVARQSSRTLSDAVTCVSSAFKMPKSSVSSRGFLRTFLSFSQSLKQSLTAIGVTAGPKRRSRLLKGFPQFPLASSRHGQSQRSGAHSRALSERAKKGIVLVRCSKLLEIQLNASGSRC